MVAHPADPRLPDVLTVVDGGARGGFSLPPALRDRLDVHCFEPDTAACHDITSRSHARSVTVWPFALGAAHGTSTLYRTRLPALSSLLRPDIRAYARHFARTATLEEWIAAHECVDTVQVGVVTLDGWASRAGVGAIDLLKLDTQGTEYEVLLGARQLLEAGRIAVVHTEASFVPFYEGQRVFTAVDRLLVSLGFCFVDCHFQTTGTAVTPTRTYTEANCRAAVADAIYAYLPSGWPDDERRTRTVVSALLLSQLGHAPLARAWLARYTAWPADAIAQAVDAWTRTPIRARLRRCLRALVPPALVHR